MAKRYIVFAQDNDASSPDYSRVGMIYGPYHTYDKAKDMCKTLDTASDGKTWHGIRVLSKDK